MCPHPVGQYQVYSQLCPNPHGDESGIFTNVSTPRGAVFVTGEPVPHVVDVAPVGTSLAPQEHTLHWEAAAIQRWNIFGTLAYRY